jgi:hypothetical protein
LKENILDEPKEVELRVRVDREVVKAALKEGLKEWMDEKVLDVGKWTIRAGLIFAFGGLIYFVLMLSGWHAPGISK